jgi:hypothetical protein
VEHAECFFCRKAAYFAYLRERYWAEVEEGLLMGEGP